MQEPVYEQLTLFQEDSPASPLVWLASKKAKKMNVTYGLKCCELSENLRRVGLSVRTYLESCVLPLPTLYRTWSVKAITSSCLILKLRLSEHRTGGNASRLLPTVTASIGEHGGPNQRDSSGRPGLQIAAQLWATPSTMDYLPQRSPEALKRLAKTARKGRSRPSNLREQVCPETVQLWRTPTANDAKNSTLPPSQLKRDALTGQLMRTMYPTPTTGAGLCGGEHHIQALKAKEQDGEITPEECRSMAAGNGGQLNPDWVEAMMGFPVGWTALEADG